MSLLVVYASRTGNLRRFIQKIEYSHFLELREGDEIVEEPYLLLVYTSSFGTIPPVIENFLEKNSSYLRAVVGSGNRNWGFNYSKASFTISERYNVPHLQSFEMSGTAKDRALFLENISQLEEMIKKDIK